MERNLRLYPVYNALLHGFFWLPVFFLFFNERVSLREVLLLEAIYYAAVVVLEVPSGYVSDRYGRKRTLAISAACLLLAYMVFFQATTFLWLAIARPTSRCRASRAACPFRQPWPPCPCSPAIPRARITRSCR